MQKEKLLEVLCKLHDAADINPHYQYGIAFVRGYIEAMEDREYYSGSSDRQLEALYCIEGDLTGEDRPVALALQRQAAVLARCATNVGVAPGSVRAFRTEYAQLRASMDTLLNRYDAMLCRLKDELYAATRDKDAKS